MRSFEEYLARKRMEYGDRFNPAGLPRRFVRYFENGKRIEVSFRDSAGKEYERKRGTVGITTGWGPSFILLLRRNSMGSSWLLSERDEIVREIG